MGTSIHAFIEWADDSGARKFSGRPEEPAWLFAKLSLDKDYALFDALGDGRNRGMAPENVGPRSLFPPRGIPNDISLETAWEYYDLIVEGEFPDPNFWPQEHLVKASEVAKLLEDGAHLGTVAQTFNTDTPAPTLWRAISNPFWHTPSWLSLSEIHQSLEHQNLTLAETHFDFQAVLAAMGVMEQLIGVGQARLVFWFDS